MERKIFFYYLLLVSSFLLFSACEQKPVVDLDSEKEKIDDVMAGGFDAVEEQDWEKMSDYISDDWTIYTHLGKKWHLEDMKDFFGKNIKDHKINISNKEYHFSESGDLAWVTFEENSSLTFMGNPGNVHALFTAIFEKEGDEWKLVHLHRSLDMPMPQMDTTKAASM